MDNLPWPPQKLVRFSAILPATPSLYPQLIAIWARSVLVSHAFLAKADFEQLQAQMPEYLRSMPALFYAARKDKPEGFIGHNGAKVEMLFVDPTAQGHGIGCALLNHVRASHGPLQVDVNEQNRAGLQFYLRRGFEIISRSALDAQWRPYPVLHLAQTA